MNGSGDAEEAVDAQGERNRAQVNEEETGGCSDVEDEDESSEAENAQGARRGEDAQRGEDEVRSQDEGHEDEGDVDECDQQNDVEEEDSSLHKEN